MLTEEAKRLGIHSSTRNRKYLKTLTREELRNTALVLGLEDIPDDADKDELIKRILKGE